MRKLMFLCVAFALVAFASCKGGEENAGGEVAETAIAPDSISAADFERLLNSAIDANDTSAIQKLIAATQSTYQKTLAANPALAEEFATKVQQVLGCSSKLASIIPNVSDLAKRVTTVPDEVMERVKEEVDNIKDTLVSAGVDAVEGAVNNVKEAATEKIEEAVVDKILKNEN